MNAVTPVTSIHKDNTIHSAKGSIVLGVLVELILIY